GDGVHDIRHRADHRRHARRAGCGGDRNIRCQECGWDGDPGRRRGWWSHRYNGGASKSRRQPDRGPHRPHRDSSRCRPHRPAPPGRPPRLHHRARPRRRVLMARLRRSRPRARQPDQPAGPRRRPPSRPHARASTLACALLLAFAPACRGEEPPPEPGPVEIAPENIAIARRTRIETGPYISGALRPRREAVLRAELAGQVAATYAEKGDVVSAGQLLARLEVAELRDALASARRAVATAEQAAAFARRNVRRAEVLYEAGGIALRDVEAARLELANA